MASPSEALKTSATSVLGGTLIRLEGVIDESLDLAQLPLEGGGIVLIDLDNVHRITSDGIREWLKELPKLSHEFLGFVRVRPSVVWQFNMLGGFAVGGQILSFYAPYICPRCEGEVEHLIDTRSEQAAIARLEPPAVRCPKCAIEAEFDDAPDAFFAYLASSPPKHVPPSVDTVLNGNARSVAHSLRITKEVRGTLTYLSLAGSLNGTAHIKRLADGLEGNVIVSMRNVTEVTPEGLDRFLQGVRGNNAATLYLSRLSPSAASAFAERPQAQDDVPIVSVRLKLACKYCVAQSYRDFAKEDLDKLRISPAMTCNECGRVLESEADQLSVALSLKLGRLPNDVAPRSDDSGDAAPLEALDKYQLVRRIGHGGMGEVFLARQTGVAGFERQVALKRLLPAMTENPEMVALFHQEARLAARVNHPNLVQITDVGQHHRSYFIAMEYVRGADLNAILRRCLALTVQIPLPIALHILSCICGGVHAAHTWKDENGTPLGLLHRDISPHNVLVSMNGMVKVTDFGVAKALESNPNGVASRVKGKLSFMAPERLQDGLGQVDARSDVFSIGVVLFQCLTLEHPFRRENERATLRAILDGELPDLAAVRPEAPPKLDAIVKRALAQNPVDRYPSALELKKDVDELLETFPERGGGYGLAEWLVGLNLEEQTVSATEEETLNLRSHEVLPPR